MPTAPIAQNVVFSKSTVKPGEEILATVKYSPAIVEEESTFTGTVVSKATGLSSDVTGTFMVGTRDLTTKVFGADTGHREWTLVSDDGEYAVFSSRG